MNDQMWYYANNGQQWGPIAESALCELLKTGRLGADTFVWKEGMANWLPFSMTPEFQSCMAPLPGSYPPAPPNALSFPGYAGFWKRFAAFIIDCIVLFPVGLVFGFVFDQVVGSPDDHVVLFQLGTAILDWLYWGIMESSSCQATAGKLALGIKVTDMKGDRISFGRATGRVFSKYISAITLTIGFLMAGFTERKQALHDIIAGCLVVNK